MMTSVHSGLKRERNAHDNLRGLREVNVPMVVVVAVLLRVQGSVVVGRSHHLVLNPLQDPEDPTHKGCAQGTLPLMLNLGTMCDVLQSNK